MRKFSPILLRVSALLLATLLLVSCKKDPNTPDSNDPSQSENITDITPQAHNGVRPPKRRRV